METGKTTKYLKYAIGEIVLVVIGILIALTINNWNQNRVNASKEYEYLIGLQNDLEKQIITYNGREKFYDRVINQGESILIDFSSKGDLLKIDSINFKLSKMMFALKYPEIRTTFNELSTTGQLNLIKEKSLRSKIIKFYQDTEDTKQRVDSNISEVYYNQIFPIIMSSVIIHPENLGGQSTKVNKELIDSQLTSTFQNNLINPNIEFEIINAISLRIIVAKTNKGSIKNAKEKSELLLKDIENELNAN